MRAIENIGWETILAPATTASGFGDTFSVGNRSVTCRLTTDTNDNPGADDAFELYCVLAYTKSTGVPTAYYPIKELDPIGGTDYSLLLGGNMTQCEIVIRGDYVWKKIEATTPAVGVEASAGYESV